VTRGSPSRQTSDVLTHRLRSDIEGQGYGHCFVGGASMFPTLRPGELVRVERRERVRRGDVVAVDIGGTPTLHRVVALTPAGVVCRGDNCRRSDPPVDLFDVYGVATMRLPGRRLRGGPVGLAIARLRYWLRLLPVFFRTTGDDLALLSKQVRGAGLPVRGDMLAGPRDRQQGPGLRLEPSMVTELVDETRTDGRGGAVPSFLSGLPSDTVVEVPAGCYSTLIAADRQKLLTRLVGHNVVIWGAHRHGVRVRVLGGMRRNLGRRGVMAGEPGDAAVRVAGEGWQRIHSFTVDGLAAELSRCGGRDVAAELVTVLGGGSYVRGTAIL
jgi:hypothetical protein